jgi:hypothetical protein
MREFLLSASWAKPLKILQRAKGFEPSTPDLGKVVLNAQSVEITHIPEAASVHHRLDDAVEQVFQPMRHVIVECLVEIFAPLCNPSFLPLVLGVRPVKCGELRL